jgi:hypothetical protein
MVTILDEGTGANGDTPSDEPYLDGEGETPDWETIFTAPDYASLINARQSNKAREYTKRVNSVLKALTVSSVNAGDLPDAAALLHHGPPFAHAAGQLADENKWAASAIDMVTTPSSPVVMFTLTGIALVSQVLRNHEAQIKEIPNARKRAKAEKKARATTAKVSPPRFTVKAFGRQWPVRFTSRVKLSKLLSGFRAQTVEPDALTFRVFSDQRLLAALEKQGIRLVKRDAPTA